MIRPFAVAMFLSATACCPLPWHRTVLDAPGSQIRVVDVAGKPVSGASVTVRRYNIGPPPRKQTGMWSATTTTSGDVSFPKSSTGEWVMPLMMHGVPQWGWELCVTAAGKEPVLATLLAQRAWSDPDEDARAARLVTVRLTDGSGSACPPGFFLSGYPVSVVGNDHRWEDSP